jgi:hypothetical protein
MVRPPLVAYPAIFSTADIRFWTPIATQTETVLGLSDMIIVLVI